MSEQLSFSEIEEPPKYKKDRVFFAIFPDADAAECIQRLTAQLSREFELQGHPLTADRLHATLFFVGDFLHGLPRAKARAASGAAASISQPAFEVVFDRVGSFPERSGHNPFVLQGGDGLAMLRAFRGALDSALVRAGFRGEESYTPHTTLLYDARFVEEKKVEPIRWVVREFELVHSLVGAGLYRKLGRWPLISA